MERQGIAVVGRSIWAIEPGPPEGPQRVAAILPRADVLRALAEHHERWQAEAPVPMPMPMQAHADAPLWAGMAAEGVIGALGEGESGSGIEGKSGSESGESDENPQPPKRRLAGLSLREREIMAALAQAQAIDASSRIDAARLLRLVGGGRSVAHLRRLLANLCESGYLDSQRGQGGGYWLVRAQ